MGYESVILDRLRDWEVGSELADAIERETRGTREWRDAWENAGSFLLDAAERRMGEGCYAVAEGAPRRSDR